MYMDDVYPNVYGRCIERVFTCQCESISVNLRKNRRLNLRDFCLVILIAILNATVLIAILIATAKSTQSTCERMKESE